jgi:hypothetical protein
MMQRFVISTATFIALTLPALAQFPPPGVYACVDATGATFGTLTLFVAGDYDFASEVVPSGMGQVASSGANVNALTGPLAEIHLTGSFSTDERGEAVFLFETDRGKLQCALPAL